MEQPETLFQHVAEIQRLLDEAGIQSMVIGGLAIAVWGKVRFTKDADLKVALSRVEASRLIASLPAEYQFLSEQPEQTLKQLGFVFLKDASGVRIDLLLAEMGFDQHAMTRKHLVEVQPGLKIFVCSPEDLIIYKLISTRVRDHEDVRGIIQHQHQTLDDQYIEDWLLQFEQALDDSTLINHYRQLRQRYS